MMPIYSSGPPQIKDILAQAPDKIQRGQNNPKLPIGGKSEFRVSPEVGVIA
jgi:hypothetical protein